MTFDVETVLRWIIIGVLLLALASVLGIVIDIGAAILGFALKILLVVFVVAVVLRFLERMRAHGG